MSRGVCVHTSEIVSKFEPLLAKSQNPSLANLIDEIFDFLVLKKKDFFLSQHQDEQGNGFYSRTLTTYFGKLNLKILRIRLANSFRPALLPPRWKRLNKEDAYHTEIRIDNCLQKVLVFIALGIELTQSCPR